MFHVSIFYVTIVALKITIPNNITLKIGTTLHGAMLSYAELL